jgi:hypothetical protein
MTDLILPVLIVCCVCLLFLALDTRRRRMCARENERLRTEWQRDRAMARRLGMPPPPPPNRLMP